MIKDHFFSSYPDPYEDTSLILGEEQKEALRQGKILQGLVYDQIERVNGTPFYMLPLSAKKFNTPKDVEQFYNEFEETRRRAGDMNMSSLFGNVNIIFLDIDYNVVNTLLDRKAFILNYFSPRVNFQDAEKIDPTVKNIIYLITFDDTNKDGLLNENDDDDLYISDVDGSNLKQITKNVTILDYDFINSNTEIFVVYEKRDLTPEEHKRKLFAKYDIQSDTLIQFLDLNQKILELEKKLMIDTVATP
jgi:hypothetical protein